MLLDEAPTRASSPPSSSICWRASRQTALVRQTALADGPEVTIVMEQEPGSAGVAVVDHYLRSLAGFHFRGVRSTGSKADRAEPLAAQAEGGTVQLRRGPWNRDFLDEVELFPFGRHDDQVDAASLAFLEPLHAQRFMEAVTVPSRPPELWMHRHRV